MEGEGDGLNWTSAEHKEAISQSFVEVPFKPTRECTSEISARVYKELAGDDAKFPLLITGPNTSRPPLLPDPGESPLYDMGPERGGTVKAYLRIMSDTYNIEVPLRMMPYKTSKDPQGCFDPEMCRALDAENRTLEDHNRYITSLLSLFINANGCSTSAGHVTLPPPPDDLSETRIKRLKAIFKDKYGSTLLAVRYLRDQDKVCEKDYKIEDAVAAANLVAFEKHVRSMQSKGKFRFRMPGSPPAYWDGNPDHRDSANRRVKWSVGENHSFISPNVVIVQACDELMTAN